MLSADLPSVVSAAGLVMVLLLARIVYGRLRPSRLRATDGVAVLSWRAAREESAGMTESEVSALRSGIRIGTADAGPAAGTFVALLVDRRLLRSRSYIFLASGYPGNPADALELLLSTSSPTEAHAFIEVSDIEVLPVGVASDALWRRYFR